jgi:hypothetical protein
MELSQGVTITEPATLDSIREEATRCHARVLYVDTRGMCSREAVVRALGDGIPMDPPITSGRIWDAVEDSLWGGLFGLEEDKIVILLTGSASFAHDEPNEFATMLDVLRCVARELADASCTHDHPKMVCVYVSR